MKKFEMSFQSNWRNYVRTWDKSRKESTIQEINSKFESFVPDSAGNYTGFYKLENRYRKVYSDYKTARQNVGMVNPVDIIIREEYGTKGSYNPNPRVFYLDIETRTGTVSQGFPNPQNAVEPVCLIQIKDSITEQIYIIGDKEFYFEKWYRQHSDIINEKIQYIRCKSEVEIFEQFFNFIYTLKPLIVYAWNGEGFDFPYLHNRAKRLGFDLNKFSPFWDRFGSNVTKLREQELQGKYCADLESAGILYIDMMKPYKKFILAPRESYSLMAIANKETKASKITHREFRTFDDFYQGNWKKPSAPTEAEKQTLCYLLNEKGSPYDVIQKAGHGQFVYYGIVDVVLLYNIDKKLGLTKLMISIAEKQNSQLVDVFGTTRVWGNATRNRLYKQQQVINPDEIQVDLEKNITGGFVREPVKGKQEWVISADVNSMYPILGIAGSNMSPENFIFARDLPDGELKEFAFKELKVGTSQEQNEQNLLNIMKDPEKAAKLKQLLKQHNYSMAPNGTFFNKSIRGVIPGMVKEIYVERKQAKKEMIKADQTVKEIQAIKQSKGN